MIFDLYLACTVSHLHSKMICAGYCAYGSATELVITYGHGVERYTLDPSIGEFILTAENIMIPAQSKTIYSVNDGAKLT